MAHVITDDCCNDTSCLRACPLNCIHPTPDEPGFFDAETLFIDPATCIDCGACTDACPVDAVRPEWKLPLTQAHQADRNAEYFATRPVPYRSLASEPRMPVLLPRDGVLRVAIIGAGPSGLYAASELLRHARVRIDIYERRPEPGGLVRYGVLPDQPSTKSVMREFGDVLADRRVRLFLDTDFRHPDQLAELLSTHHAVILATGAVAGRRLTVPGNELAGNISGVELAGWVNGHQLGPRQAPDLSTPRAVVIGNGNVALDAARILLLPPRELSALALPADAWKTLAQSRIREVVIVGRRGPREAAFTASTLRAFSRYPDIAVHVDAGPDEPVNLDTRVVKFRFWTEPLAIVGESTVRQIILTSTARPEKPETLPTGLIVHAIGNTVDPPADLALDHDTGAVRHRAGRVIDATGLYVAGWLKRGPRGKIGVNRPCSRETALSVLEDFRDGLLPGQANHRRNRSVRG